MAVQGEFDASPQQNEHIMTPLAKLVVGNAAYLLELHVTVST